MLLYWAASKNNCQWNNFPTLYSHSRSASQIHVRGVSRLRTCHLRECYSSRCITCQQNAARELTDRRTERRIIHVPPHFSEFSKTWGRESWLKSQTCSAWLFIDEILPSMEVSSKLCYNSQKSAVGDPTCRFASNEFFPLWTFLAKQVDGVSWCGVCLQWGECKLCLKSDL